MICMYITMINIKDISTENMLILVYVDLILMITQN